jgi:hypothetical protein
MHFFVSCGNQYRFARTMHHVFHLALLCFLWQSASICSYDAPCISLFLVAIGIDLCIWCAVHFFASSGNQHRFAHVMHHAFHLAFLCFLWQSALIRSCDAPCWASMTQSLVLILLVFPTTACIERIEQIVGMTTTTGTNPNKLRWKFGACGNRRCCIIHFFLCKILHTGKALHKWGGRKVEKISG